MYAREIMTSHPVAITPDESVAKAAAVMRDLNVGILPVVNDRMRMRLEGLITDRDIVIRCVAQGHDPECHVREHMTTGPLHTVRPDAEVDDVIDLMSESRVRRIPVTEDGERLVGLITQTDIGLRLGPIRPYKVEQLIERISQHGYVRH